ncbi:MAG TPA: Hsp20/alpha crystallin family protein [Chlamydiales bacterium]|nr:Hsp20/alpha crystallin family protein [Chlamydiales bacterium]
MEKNERSLRTVFPFSDFWESGYQTGLSVSEDKKHVYVEAELPGLKANEIEMTFEHGILWIRGEHKEEKEDKGKKYFKKSARSFSYRLQTPGGIDESKKPDAMYQDGVMKIVFDKSSESRGKKISFKTK